MKKRASQNTLSERTAEALAAHPGGHTDPLYPIYAREELASIAARLLEGNDYPRAVRRAIALLQECDKQRLETEEQNRIAQEIEMEVAAVDALESLSGTEKASLPLREKIRLNLPILFLDALTLPQRSGGDTLRVD